MEIRPTGNAVNLVASALLDTPVGLWGNKIWDEMHAVATCSLDVDTPGSLRVE